MSNRPVYRRVLRWRHLVNACEVKAHLIGCWQNLSAVCFWQPIPSGLDLVVAALRGRLLHKNMLYTVCEVERFVLTTVKRRLLNRKIAGCWLNIRQTNSDRFI